MVLIAAANQCDPSMLCLDFILHRKPVRAVAPKSLARRTIHDQLLRALEKHFPYTVEALEGSFELILGEFARQALKTYRCSKLPRRSRGCLVHRPQTLLGLSQPCLQRSA
jgi:hypothetical protein